MDNDELDDFDFGVEYKYTIESYKFGELVYSYNRGKFTLTKPFDVHFVLMSNEDGAIDKIEYVLNIKEGFSIDHFPFPRILRYIFPQEGIDKNYIGAAFFLAAMYEENGIDKLFGRDDCDSYYLFMLNKSKVPSIIKFAWKLLGTTFVGSTYKWNTMGSETTVATITANDVLR